MDMGRELYYGVFGSHLFGTNVPESDHDYKGIFLPTVNDILLQRAGKPSIHRNTNKSNHTKNTAKDNDIELFTLQGFLKLCAEGQTAALDMLFTPTHHWIHHSPEWSYLQQNKDKLIHKGMSAFVGYCKNQAAKYGVKGSRLEAAELAVQLMCTYPSHHRLRDYWGEIEEWVEEAKKTGEYCDEKDGQTIYFIDIVQCKGPNGEMVDHLEINGRKVPCHSKVNYAKATFQRIIDTYGERAKKAKDHKGIDWKALMHAVRIAKEAEELLLTGHITLPRPEKDLLVDIRKGNLSYDKVAALIEEGLLKVNDAVEKSTLPSSIDVEFWNDFLLSVHISHVVEGTVRIDTPLRLNVEI